MAETGRTSEAGSGAGPGCLLAAVALGGAATIIAVGLTLALGSGVLFPVVWIVTLFVVAILGTPAFLLIRRRPTWYWIATGGFVTGALVPAWIVLSNDPPDDAMINGIATFTDGSYTTAGLLFDLAYVAAFGGLGIAGAFLAWLIIRSQFHAGDAPRLGSAILMLLVCACVIGLAVTGIAQWGHQDSSCHNTLRDGRESISPVATFNLRVTMNEWSAVQSELDRFARENGWHTRADVRPDPGFPWFQVSLCREPGTEIFIHNAGFEENQMSVSVFQPQGGDSWQTPMRMLQDQFERRWPGRTGYDEYDPRPPWARTPAELPDTRLRAPEKSL